ncbi:MAG: hypothetical protein AB8I08_01200 [Sandaracinaceae bacterium]
MSCCAVSSGVVLALRLERLFEQVRERHEQASPRGLSDIDGHHAPG